jgi:hypothetical protein
MLDSRRLAGWNGPEHRIDQDMSKLFHCVDDQWVEHSHPPIFHLHESDSGTPRVAATAPGGDPMILRSLADCLAPPFILLYVLHTSRGEGETGRYQSPDLSRAQLHGFLDHFADYLQNDSRFDLWVHSPDDRAVVVWDRHNLIWAYGPTDCFIALLRRLGFHEGSPSVDFEHEHHYRPAYDGDAKALLGAFNWHRTPLRPEDEQWPEKEQGGS